MLKRCGSLGAIVVRIVFPKIWPRILKLKSNLVLIDVGGGNAKDTDEHSLANIALKWMIKEIIASETGLIFRRSAMERANMNLDELLAAAERTKMQDARHKVCIHLLQFFEFRDVLILSNASF